MSLTVVIECTASGPIGGYLEQRVHHTDTVGSLIEKYCSYKKIHRDPAYVLIARDLLLRESMNTLSEAGIKDGDHLFLVKQGDPSVFGFNRWWVLCAIILTIGVVGLATITILYISAVYPPFDYGIVFDAGSSHTTMFLYTWQGDKANGTGVVRQLDHCEVQGGGIAEEFRNSPSGVMPYLKECLDKGIEMIPEDRRSGSPLHLAATAGMRVLAAEDPEAEMEILGNITSLFEGTPLRSRPGAARTICGEEEALSGWITVNYLSDTLTPARKALRSKREAFTVKTVGALDLGGASTQVTFEIPPPDLSKNNITDCGKGVKSLKLYGKTYYLYSRSFLCFGVNEFRKMYYVLLLEGLINQSSIADAVKNVSSPCENVGYFHTEPYSAIFSFCSETAFLDKFKGLNITFNGVGNFTECQRYMERILDNSQCSNTFMSGNCFEPTPARNYTAVFAAFSSFGFMARGLNVTSTMGPDGFLNASRTVCGLTWDEMNHNTYPGIKPKFLKNTCMDSLYQYNLMRNEYKISDDEWQKLSFSQTIDGTDVGWSLGFMINGTNIIPAEAPLSSMLSLTGFIILGVFFICLVTMAAVLAMIAMRKGRIVDSRPLQLVHTQSDGSRQSGEYI